MSKMNVKLIAAATMLGALSLGVNAQVAKCVSGIGNGANYGYADYNADTDTYTLVNGNTGDIWGSSDSLYFVYTTVDLDTDFDFMTRIESFSGNSDQAWMKAGMLYREGIYADWGDPSYYGFGEIGYQQDTQARSFFTYGCRNDGKGKGTSTFNVERRETRGGNINDDVRVNSGINQDYPDWLRLARRGTTFFAFYSDNGVDWTLMDTRETAGWEHGALGSKAYSDYYYSQIGDSIQPCVGMFVVSNEGSEDAATAVFSGFQETPLTAPDFNPGLVDVTLTAGVESTLSATISGTAPFNWVMTKDGKEIGNGVTGNAAFSFKLGIAMSDTAGEYTLKVSNPSGEVTSTANVTVAASTVDPELLGACYNPAIGKFTVTFNKPMAISSLTNKANYVLKGQNGATVNISSIEGVYGNTAANITANVSAGEVYTLTVSGVADDNDVVAPTAEKTITVLTNTKYVAERFLNTGFSRWNNDSTQIMFAFRDDYISGKAGAPDAIIDLTGGLSYNKSELDNFCFHVSGYLLAPQTGNYRFGAASDDQVAFYMNLNGMDSNRDNLTRLCYCTAFSGVRNYTAVNASRQNSELVSLAAGQLYYFEFFFEDEAGGEVFDIAWSLPNEGPTETIAIDTPGISADYVFNFFDPSATELFIDAEPEDVSTVSYSSFTLPVEVTYSTTSGNLPTYKWQVKQEYGDGTWKDASVMINASGVNTTTLAITEAQSWENNGLYRLSISLDGKTITTREIKVTVSDEDTVPPYATVSGHNSMNKVIITFSEPVMGYEDVSMYTIPGLDILDIQYGEISKVGYSVVLITSTQEPGKEYTVKFDSSITDYAGLTASDATFKAYTWYPGMVVLEAFNQTSSFDTLFEVANWTKISPGYYANPQLSSTLEIHSSTFNLDNCVETITGYIVPQESGTYEFSGSQDDDYKMWVGKADAPASELTDADLVSYAVDWNSAGERKYNDWTGASQHGMNAVALEAGKKYYFLVALREGSGGDFVTMTWRNTKNDWQANDTRPILADDLIGCYIDPNATQITIRQQPVAATVTAGDMVTFSTKVVVKSEYATTPSYQWYVGETAIEGATAAEANFLARQEYDGQPVTCVISALGNAVTTDPVILTVNQLSTLIAPISVQGTGKEVTVTFDGNIDIASGTDVANYKIDGATIDSAKISTFIGQPCVVLTLAEKLDSSLVTVTVSNVGNVSGLPMKEPVTLTGGYTFLQFQNLGTCAGYPIVNPDNVEIHSNGADIWDSADRAAYIYHEVSGDFDIVVRFDDLEFIGQTYTKMGLQFRATLDANSPVVSYLSCPVESSWNVVRGDCRPNPAGSASIEQWPSDVGGGVELHGSYNNGDPIYPCYFRLQRIGDKFTAYRSVNKKVWLEINTGDFTTIGGDATYQMPADGYVGIVVSSYDVSTYTTATFSEYDPNFIYVPPTDFNKDPDYTDIDIGDGTVLGAYDYNKANGTYQVFGSGSDVWNASDNFYYVYQLAPEGDFVYTVRLDSFKSMANNWAKAGIMIREGEEDGTFNQTERYFLAQACRDYKPGSGSPRISWRSVDAVSVTDEYCVGLTEGTTWPTWMRLVREGNVLKAYLSFDDAQTWTLYKEEDTADPNDRLREDGSVLYQGWYDGPMGSVKPLYVGMWVTSHSATANDACAVFSNVSLVKGSQPEPTEMVLNYAVEDGNLVLSWSASYGDAALEVADSINGAWTALPPAELVGGAFQMVIPMSEVSNGSFYRLSK